MTRILAYLAGSFRLVYWTFFKPNTLHEHQWAQGTWWKRFALVLQSIPATIALALVLALGVRAFGYPVIFRGIWSGIAAGVISGLVFGMLLGVAPLVVVTLVLAILMGIPNARVVSILCGAITGTVVGVSGTSALWGVAFGIGLSVAIGTIWSAYSEPFYGLMVSLAFGIAHFGLHLYIFEVPVLLVCYTLARRPSNRKHIPTLYRLAGLLWHETLIIPLPYLDRFLALLLEYDQELGEAEIHRVATMTNQVWAVRRVAPEYRMSDKVLLIGTDVDPEESDLLHLIFGQKKGDTIIVIVSTVVDAIGKLSEPVDLVGLRLPLPDVQEHLFLDLLLARSDLAYHRQGEDWVWVRIRTDEEHDRLRHLLLSALAEESRPESE